MQENHLAIITKFNLTFKYSNGKELRLRFIISFVKTQMYNALAHSKLRQVPHRRKVERVYDLRRIWVTSCHIMWMYHICTMPMPRNVNKWNYRSHYYYYDMIWDDMFTPKYVWPFKLRYWNSYNDSRQCKHKHNQQMIADNFVGLIIVCIKTTNRRHKYADIDR